jgi:ADP-ribose pyrophosphatase YjhB (NUDIX family)
MGFKLSSQEFEAIYSKVPRLCVEVIIKSKEGIVLSLRAVPPCIGQWHLPGGTVFFNESMEQTVKRVAKEECGLNVAIERMLHYIDYMEFDEGFGRHTISIAFLVKPLSGKLRHDFQAIDIGFFKRLPGNTIKKQKEFLLKYKLIKE